MSIPHPSVSCPAIPFPPCAVFVSSFFFSAVCLAPWSQGDGTAEPTQSLSPSSVRRPTRLACVRIRCNLYIAEKARQLNSRGAAGRALPFMQVACATSLRCPLRVGGAAGEQEPLRSPAPSTGLDFNAAVNQRRAWSDWLTVDTTWISYKTTAASVTLTADTSRTSPRGWTLYRDLDDVYSQRPPRHPL